MLPIKGLHKTSLIDFPPNTSCVVFIGGCNMRCGFCQNADMVDAAKLPNMKDTEIFEFLENRKEWLDAVVITGGEPTLYRELIPFIETIKSMGFKVKLDTNGTNPELLEKILPMLDYVAMDIKADKENYSKAAGKDVDIDKIEKSIALLQKHAKDYEFRTTVVPKYFNEETAKKIGQWLAGSRRYALQAFRPQATLDPEFPKNRYCSDSMKGFKDIAAEFFGEVIVR